MEHDPIAVRPHARHAEGVAPASILAEERGAFDRVGASAEQLQVRAQRRGRGDGFGAGGGADELLHEDDSHGHHRPMTKLTLVVPLPPMFSVWNVLAPSTW